MKIVRTNTSQLKLSWSAAVAHPRALHRLLGGVHIAAGHAEIPDDDVAIVTTPDRSTVSFVTERIDLPQKPAMSAWNAKSLADSGTEFTATETVTIAYALPELATTVDLIEAISLI